jgi:hypothetical protein
LATSGPTTDRLVSFTIRTALSVAGVALILTLVTCCFVIWRRGIAKRRLAAVVVADVTLIAAFLLAPWAAIALATASLPTDLVFLCFGPGALIRSLPSLSAGIGTMMFAIMTRNQGASFAPVA